ncbi:GrpB family protein [Alkalihalophilus sp. As8PL]|uniref:GrpB family protein n=1 Tax=Alkalihalophilus sp. As8PL TaxID=3237103 RepID=A0AB39BV99_9BACI
MREVKVVPYQEKWVKTYESEKEQIETVLDGECITIHHIGSTAIPTISAKPIIDMMVEVKDIKKVDDFNVKFENLGYEAMGENGITDRRFFKKGGDNRTHHVHIFEQESIGIKRHLAFRDYMLAHPDEARRYSELKQKLARNFPSNIDRYIEGKDAYIKEIEKKALEWMRENKE